jgi:hypothetical protein
MWRCCRDITLLLALSLFATATFAQSPGTQPNPDQKKVTAEEPKPADVQSEITTLKAENAAVRELLRKMEEQQKALLEQMDRLQRRLDNATVANGQPAQSQPTIQLASATIPTSGTNTSSTPPDANDASRRRHQRPCNRPGRSLSGWNHHLPKF